MFVNFCIGTQLLICHCCLLLSSFRSIPQYELDFIASSALKILDCDFAHLPAAIVSQRYMTGRQYSGTASYRTCIQSDDAKTSKVISSKMNGATVNDSKGNGFKLHGSKAKGLKAKNSKANSSKQQAFKCKSFVRKDCPTHFEKPLNASKLFQCYNHLHIQPNKALGNLQSFKMHSKCMQDASSVTQRCTKPLADSCEQRHVRSFKTIRMSMEMMETLLKQEPSLKIIHLVRDPRGILSSRFATSQVSGLAKRKMDKEAKVLCHRMLFDLDEYSKLHEKYPNNIVQVRYEDIATSPEESAKVLYQFTRGIAVPEQVESFIKKNTHATKDNGSYGTARKDSAAMAMQWKTKLSVQNRNITSTICKSVIEKLGYS